MGPKARGRGWGGWGGCCNIATRHPSPAATLLQCSDHILQHLMRGEQGRAGWGGGEGGVIAGGRVGVQCCNMGVVGAMLQRGTVQPGGGGG